MEQFAPMRKIIIALILVLNFAGVFFSSYLLNRHIEIKAGSTEKSVCDINDTFNCDAVNSSEYAEIKGIPVAGLGLIYHIILSGLLFLALIHKNQTSSKAHLSFGFFISTLSVIASAIMAWFSHKIGFYCLFCMGLYAVNLFTMLLFPMALGLSFTEFFSFLKKYFLSIFEKEPTMKTKFLPHAFLSLAAFLIGVFIISCTGKTEAPEPKAEPKPKIEIPKTTPPVSEGDKIENQIKKHYEQKKIDIDVTGLPHLGNPKAPLVIVEFADFQCPFCKVAATSLKKLYTEYKGDIVIYFANYPLDNECNPALNRPMHPNGCEAALASICADQKGKFWEMSHLLFGNQKSLNPETIKNLGVSIGLDSSFMNSCPSAPETKKQLKVQLDLAEKMQIHSTPSLFLNGRKLDDWRNDDFMDAVIEAEYDRSE